MLNHWEGGWPHTPQADQLLACNINIEGLSVQGLLAP